MSLSKRAFGLRGYRMPWNLYWKRFFSEGALHVSYTNGGRTSIERRQRGRAADGSLLVGDGVVGFEVINMPVNLSPAEMLAAARNAKPPAPADSGDGYEGFIADMPYVRAFMQTPLPGDKAGKCVGSLLFFWDGDVWKVCLSDREAQRSVWGQGSSLESSCSSLEERLRAGTADWRRDKSRFGKK